jgi:hypothetical protein
MCDIDFHRRTVTVAGTVKELAGHLSLEPDAKTEQSLRSLVAPAFLIDELARHLAMYRGSPDADSEALVFLGPKGGVLRRGFEPRSAHQEAGSKWQVGEHFHRPSALTAPDRDYPRACHLETNAREASAGPIVDDAA